MVTSGVPPSFEDGALEGTAASSASKGSIDVQNYR